MSNEVFLRRLRVILKELDVLIAQIEDLGKEPKEPRAYG